MKTLFNSNAIRSTSSAAIIAATALSAWLPAQRTARADTINVTGIPASITSFVPAKATVGETLLVNHTAPTGTASAPASLEFRSADGNGRRAAVTRVTDKLFRVTIPAGAISGATTLIDAQGNRRAQPAMTIVPAALRARGISIINKAQYEVDSVKNGATELLPSGTRIPTGEARFVVHSFIAQPSVILTLRYVYLPPQPNPGTLIIGAAPIPVLGERIVAALPKPNMSTPAKALSARLRREVELESLSVLDLLGVTDTPARWRVIQAARDRSMEIREDGRVVLRDRFPSGSSITREYLLQGFGNGENAASIRFRLVDPTLPAPSARDQVLSTITVHAPFDTFATDALGIFNRAEDDQIDNSPGAQILGTSFIPAPPILVRRAN